MSKRMYVDTNAWLDYCLNRESDKFKAEIVQHIFSRALSCEFVIVLSDILLVEVKKFVDIDILIRNFEKVDKIIHIKTSQEDIRNSKKLSHSLS